MPHSSALSGPAAEFALEVVQRLRSAGFQALLAGGCVRDLVMGLAPKDFDVATDARPEQVRDLFGRKRTLNVGAAFGVVIVVGPKGIPSVEVATFRQDLGYSDGRRPDAVAYSTAEEDARRRDFTINGMFWDPSTGSVVDYVGGQEDLHQGVIRAIGEPAQRFAEDKLRMLRAVRFSATLNFELDPATSAAVQRHAAEIACVSAERITAELRRMWVDGCRRRAAELLLQTGLLAALFPETQAILAACRDEPAPGDAARAAGDTVGDQSGDSAESPSPAVPPTRAYLESCGRLQSDEFITSLALVAWHFYPNPVAALKHLAQRFKLTRREQTLGQWMLSSLPAIQEARNKPWPKLQRFLVHPDAPQLLAFADAVRCVDEADVQYCRAKLSLPMEELNPPPLVSGEDLKQLGIGAGPVYTRILESVRDAQLAGTITTREEARRLAEHLAQQAPLE